MNKTALVIMAAGIGSRFGAGIKQFMPIGPNGELLMEYSIYDAVQAGFDSIYLILRRSIHHAFDEAAGWRIQAFCVNKGVKLEIVYQDMEDLPEGHSLPAERSKPWGTGHAVLACRKLLSVPFAVINADDYYGRESFEKVHAYLAHCDPARDDRLCMIGFVLGNTLSKNGGVTRGVCRVDEQGNLLKICETRNIRYGCEGIESDGGALSADNVVSMNMWGFAPSFIPLLESGFKEFLSLQANNPAGKDAEYLLPIYIGQLVDHDRVRVSVLASHEKWFGVTYNADAVDAGEKMRNLIANGRYPAMLAPGKSE